LITPAVDGCISISLCLSISVVVGIGMLFAFCMFPFSEIKLSSCGLGLLGGVEEWFSLFKICLLGAPQSRGPSRTSRGDVTQPLTEGLRVAQSERG